MIAKHLHLRWTYQSEQENLESDTTDVVVPPRQVLEELLVLAERNRVQELRSQLEHLKDSDTQYVPFAEALLKLARQFQSEEIETLLQQHLTGEVTNV